MHHDGRLGAEQTLQGLLEPGDQGTVIGRNRLRWGMQVVNGRAHLVLRTGCEMLVRGRAVSIWNFDDDQPRVTRRQSCTAEPLVGEEALEERAAVFLRHALGESPRYCSVAGQRTLRDS